MQGGGAIPVASECRGAKRIHMCSTTEIHGRMICILRTNPRSAPSLDLFASRAPALGHEVPFDARNDTLRQWGTQGLEQRGA